MKGRDCGGANGGEGVNSLMLCQSHLCSSLSYMTMQTCLCHALSLSCSLAGFFSVSWTNRLTDHETVSFFFPFFFRNVKVYQKRMALIY